MKAVLAVIGGYFTMVLVVMVLTNVGYAAIGTSGAYVPGGYAPSQTWIVIMLVSGIAAALAGGMVCAKIADGKGVLALAIVVLIVGAILGWMTINREIPADRPETRPDDLKAMEAMMWAESPTWINIVNPIIGAVGVLIGAGIARKKGS